VYSGHFVVFSEIRDIGTGGGRRDDATWLRPASSAH